MMFMAGMSWVVAMRLIFSRRSSRNRSIAQSWTVEVVGVQLQESLKMCCPSFAEEW